MKKIGVFLVVAMFMLVSTAVASAHPGPAGHPHHVRGEIASIDTSGSALTFLRLNGASTTLTVTTETMIRKNGHIAPFDQLALGDRGHVKFTRTETSEALALKIIVKTPFMTGRVTEVTSDTVTLKRAKVTKTFMVDANTLIRRKGAEAVPADLKVGDAAKVFYNKTEGGELLARRIRAGGRKH